MLRGTQQLLAACMPAGQPFSSCAAAVRSEHGVVMCMMVESYVQLQHLGVRCTSEELVGLVLDGCLA
jgi:hypothetical protein